MISFIRLAGVIAVCTLATMPFCIEAQTPMEPGRHLIEVVSSIDGSLQPSYIILPPGFDRTSSEIPIVVSLHSWSIGFEQRHEALENLVAERGWIYLFPNFRGRNDHFEA